MGLGFGAGRLIVALLVPLFAMSIGLSYVPAADNTQQLNFKLSPSGSTHTRRVEHHSRALQRCSDQYRQGLVTIDYDNRVPVSSSRPGPVHSSGEVVESRPVEVVLKLLTWPFTQVPEWCWALASAL
jgi:hypothetical protein